MAAIKVMSAGAVKSMVAALAADFERAGGDKLDLNFGTAGSLRERIKNGEVADLVVLSESAIAELAKLGIVVPGSVTDLLEPRHRKRFRCAHMFCRPFADHQVRVSFIDPLLHTSFDPRFVVSLAGYMRMEGWQRGAGSWSRGQYAGGGGLLCCRQ